MSVPPESFVLSQQIGDVTRRVVERIRVEEADQFAPDPWLTEVVFLATLGRPPIDVLAPLLRRTCEPGDMWTLLQSDTPTWHRESFRRKGSLTQQAAELFETFVGSSRPIMTIICSAGVDRPRIWLRGYFGRAPTEAKQLLSEMLTCMDHPEAIMQALLSGDFASSLTLTALDPSIGERTREESRAAAASRLNDLIALFGLSAQETGEVLKVSRESIRKWVNGADIDFEHQARIAEAYELLQHALSAIRTEALPTVMRRSVAKFGRRTRLDLLRGREFSALWQDFDRLAGEDVLMSA